MGIGIYEVVVINAYLKNGRSCEKDHRLGPLAGCCCGRERSRTHTAPKRFPRLPSLGFQARSK